MQKYIKLKEVLSLKNLYNQYIQEFNNRKEDIVIEFHFDFNDLSEAEQLGYSCYINQMQSRLFTDWEGITKYLKSINQGCGKITKYRYEFYTEEEYKKHNFKLNLKFTLEILGTLIGMGLIATWAILKKGL